MTKLNEIYKCSICGNTVEMVHAGAGELVCCGQPMKLMSENTEDAAKEKHVPVIEKLEKGVKVKIGEMAHPMEEAHHIEWIEMINDHKTVRKYLKPGLAPEVEFCCYNENTIIRAYCNLHGLWKA
ncbi:MAG: desulfoferrodoxin [Patescibacteria group bacterium]